MFSYSLNRNLLQDFLKLLNFREFTTICIKLNYFSSSYRMEKATGNDIAEELYDLLGYDHNEQKISIGPLAENTHPQIRGI